MHCYVHGLSNVVHLIPDKNEWHRADIFLSLKIVLTLTNSVDNDEKPYSLAFHLCLHCLQKYPFRDFQHKKGLKNIVCPKIKVSYRPFIASTRFLNQGMYP